MNIEINKRQSGKSTRLLKKINECSSLNIVIVSHSLDGAKSILDKYKRLYPADKRKIKVSSKMLRGFINFVDEFDFIKSENLFKDENSYYCTTLKNPILQEVVFGV
jgi:ABC-type transporter Mla maintaining outer membrane lipid asymmetry ATPase subunit MlaF